MSAVREQLLVSAVELTTLTGRQANLLRRMEDDGRLCRVERAGRTHYTWDSAAPYLLMALPRTYRRIVWAYREDGIEAARRIIDSAVASVAALAVSDR